MGESTIRLQAVRQNLPTVMRFTEEHLDDTGCSLRTRMQIELAVEEIFVNIAGYAYAPGSGDVVICMEITGDPATAVITFTDQGKVFDPLKKEDPDVTLPAEKRQIGGLGIFTVRRFMDNVQYERVGSSNVLTLTKQLV